jgi:hypothetical protein
MRGLALLMMHECDERVSFEAMGKQSWPEARGRAADARKRFRKARKWLRRADESMRGSDFEGFLIGSLGDGFTPNEDRCVQEIARAFAGLRDEETMRRHIMEAWNVVIGVSVETLVETAKRLREAQAWRALLAVQRYTKRDAMLARVWMLFVLHLAMYHAVPLHQLVDAYVAMDGLIEESGQGNSGERLVLKLMYHAWQGAKEDMQAIVRAGLVERLPELMKGITARDLRSGDGVGQEIDAALVGTWNMGRDVWMSFLDKGGAEALVRVAERPVAAQFLLHIVRDGGMSELLPLVRARIDLWVGMIGGDLGVSATAIALLREVLSDLDAGQLAGACTRVEAVVAALGERADPGEVGGCGVMVFRLGDGAVVRLLSEAFEFLLVALDREEGFRAVCGQGVRLSLVWVS